MSKLENKKEALVVHYFVSKNQDHKTISTKLEISEIRVQQIINKYLNTN